MGFQRRQRDGCRVGRDAKGRPGATALLLPTC
jgi:hypothetical protein